VVHLQLCEYHLGVLKYRPKLRALYLEVAFINLLYKRLVMRVLKDALTNEPLAAVGTLPWLQARRASCLELAGNIGLLHKLEEVKSRLKRHSRIDALLVNGATAIRQQGASEIVASEIAVSEFVTSEIVVEGKSRRGVTTESFRRRRASAFELAAPSIRDWDLVTEGRPNSTKRRAQIERLLIDQQDRSARGVDEDPYRIGDPSSLLHLREGSKAKDALNARGRTEEGRMVANACRALGTAVLQSREFILKRHPDNYDLSRELR
jgi:hypothetical protein